MLHTQAPPSVITTLIILGWRQGSLHVLVAQPSTSSGSSHPHVFPQTSLERDESPLEAAHRALKALTKQELEDELFLEIGSFIESREESLERRVGITFVAMIPPPVQSALDETLSHEALSQDYLWYIWEDLFKEENLLSITHQSLLQRTQHRLTEITLTSPLLLRLLGDRFRVRHARHLYRQISGRSITPRTFKGWLFRTDALRRVGRALYSARTSLKRPW